MYDNKILRQLADAAGLDILRVHEKIGLSHPVSYYSAEDPSAEELEKIADFFFVSVDLLLGREEERQKAIMISSQKYDSLYPYNLFEKIFRRPIDKQIKKDNMDGLDWAMRKCLTDKDIDIVDMYFKDGATYEMIGNKYDISRECVRQHIEKSLRKLRHPMYKDVILTGLLTTEEQNRQIQKKTEKLNSREEYLKAMNDNLKKKELLLDKKIQEFALKKNVSPQAVKSELNSDCGTVSFLDNIRIDDLQLSVRSTNVLKRSGIKTATEIKRLLDDDYTALINLRSMGIKSFEEILEKMDEILGTNYQESITDKLKEDSPGK